MTPDSFYMEAFRRRIGSGQTTLLLHAAIDVGNQERALSMIQQSFGFPLVIDARDGANITPLMLAAGKGILPVMRALVDHGADVKARDSAGGNAVEHALRGRHEAAAVWLVEEVHGEMTPQAAECAAVLSMPNVFKALVRRMRTCCCVGEEQVVQEYMGTMAAACITQRLAGRLPVCLAFVEEGLDVTQWRGAPQGARERMKLIEIASRVGDEVVVVYLREIEGSAPPQVEAAIRAKQEAQAAAAEAARRRARNERRREREKKAKAHRQAQQEGETDGVANVIAKGNGQEEDEWDEAILEAALAELDVSKAWVKGEKEPVAESQEQPEQEEAPLVDEAVAVAVVEPPAPVPAPARPPSLPEFLEMHVPDVLRCPITLRLINDPVMVMADGSTYSRAAIEQLLAACRESAQPLTSPATSVEIDATQVVLVPKRVRGLISDFKATKTKEWEAAEQRWQAWTAEQEQEGNGSA